MNVLFVVTHPNAAPYLHGLSGACARSGVAFSVFFSGDGVRSLLDPNVLQSMSHAHETVACEHSWNQKTSQPCPVTLGSQTDHSRMIGSAERVVSL